jgi:hypothetical protein
VEAGILGRFMEALDRAPRKGRQLKAAESDDDGWPTTTADLGMIPNCPTPPPVGPGFTDKDLERAFNPAWVAAKMNYGVALARAMDDIASVNAGKCAEACPNPNPNPIPVLQ